MVTSEKLLDINFNVNIHCIKNYHLHSPHVLCTIIAHYHTVLLYVMMYFSRFGMTCNLWVYHSAFLPLFLPFITEKKRWGDGKEEKISFFFPVSARTQIKSHLVWKKELTYIIISSDESQKGVIAAQRCSIENQKGAIAVQSQWQ